jgi:16S rRNA G966 N2-methylase RsmD
VASNRLYYGDNLDVLRRHVRDECVDLVYLDPPFQSGKNYNIFFRNEAGVSSEEQVQAFKDTWFWGLESARDVRGCQRVPCNNRYRDSRNRERRRKRSGVGRVEVGPRRVTRRGATGLGW